MKQLLFLLLFPAFALAQYPGNANQKITLGEQTTADGLVYRGLASADTVAATSKITRANKQDTSAFLLLDTITNLLWHYKTASNGWTQAGGSTFDTTTLNLTTRFATKLNISDTSSMLTPYFRDADTASLNLNSRFAEKQNTLTLTTTGSSGAATLVNSTLNIPQYSSGGVTDGDKGDIDVTNSGATWTIDTSAISLSGNKVTGTLPVANGGTGSATQNFVDLTTTQSIGGAKTFTSELTATRFNPTGTSATGNGMYLPASNTLGFSTYGTERMRITSGGDININMPNSTNRYLSWYSGNGLYQVAAISSITDPSFNDAGILIFSTARTSSAGFTEKMRITPNGNVGIGVESPQSGYRLHVADSVYVGGNVSASAYTTRSDYDLKDEIQNINYGINEVMQMQPVKYTYKSNGSTQLGFIAQDLGVITPEVVSFEDKMSVYYNALIPILTKAIQEQQALIKALEQRILTLENK